MLRSVFSDFANSIRGLSRLTDWPGPGGWKQLKAAYAEKQPSAGQKEKMEWYEESCVNGYKSGLKGDAHWVWNKAEVNRQLGALPNMPTSHDSGR